MTYGLEWNSKASRGEEVRSKKLERQLELLDLPAEILVIILHSLGYDELRSMELACSYLRSGRTGEREREMTEISFQNAHH